MNNGTANKQTKDEQQKTTTTTKQQQERTTNTTATARVRHGDDDEQTNEHEYQIPYNILRTTYSYLFVHTSLIYTTRVQLVFLIKMRK